MPGSLQAWYSIEDLKLLADRDVVLRGDFELATLARLSDIVHVDRPRAITAALVPERTANGRLLLRLAFKGALSLVCQRCLEPLEHELDDVLEWIVVDSDAAAQSLGDGEHALVLDRDRLCFDELLEDELIVALPLAPRHASIDECGPLPQNFSDVLRSSDTAEVVGPREL